MKSHLPQSLTCLLGPAAIAVESTSGQSPIEHDVSASDDEDAATAIEDVEEFTKRLPTSELIRIIKGALERGKRNLPFTQRDLLRAMTIPPPAPGNGVSLEPR